VRTFAGPAGGVAATALLPGEGLAAPGVGHPGPRRQQDNRTRCQEQHGPHGALTAITRKVFISPPGSRIDT
jgi:hypothetical protein